MRQPVGRLIRDRVLVEVPATSANLGAGYDCAGVALDLANRVELIVDASGEGAVALEVRGEGRGELPAARDNRFMRGVDAVMRQAGVDGTAQLGWRVAMDNEIPLARGLGSSAAATVGGLVAGNALIPEPLPVATLLALAAEIEGHADNAAPALLGGFVLVARVDGALRTVRFEAPPGLRAVLFIPELRLRTSDMRAALPAEVPMPDAVANLGAVALGVAGLATGRLDLLGALTVDRLHEPYRAKAYPQLPRLVEAARSAGALGACLSGAGSTILAFADTAATASTVEAALAAAARETELPGRAMVVTPQNAGAWVLATD